MYNYLPKNQCCPETTPTNNCNQNYQISSYGCVKNICKTNFPVTSEVVYNGIELTCTLINPCDTVSVALQKIDLLLCSLNNQIISLTEEVEELTEQLEEAENNISIIVNILEDCCPQSTTTTTTLIPITTTTTTSEIPLTTTTTTSVEPTTTTTSTTVTPAECAEYFIEGNDIVDGLWTAIKCDGVNTQYIGGVVPVGDTITTSCIVSSTLVLVNCSIKLIKDCS
jgi:hypothetical protein